MELIMSKKIENLIERFSKSSKKYRDNSFLQQKVAEKLIKQIDKKYKRIIDLGAGTGIVANLINWNYEKFLAVDLSQKMLELHKQNQYIQILNKSFDDDEVFKIIKDGKYEVLISSSALQWSQDFSKVCENIKKLDISVFLAIFSNNTFKELHQYFQIQSPILSRETILQTCDNFQSNFFQGKIKFSSSKELLQYIKNSGVSGGIYKLNPAILKQFIRDNNLKQLSFEVIFLSKIKDD
jgi:malonyl-CoA O-methyltransferase